MTLWTWRYYKHRTCVCRYVDSVVLPVSRRWEWAYTKELEEKVVCAQGTTPVLLQDGLCECTTCVGVFVGVNCVHGITRAWAMDLCTQCLSVYLCHGVLLYKPLVYRYHTPQLDQGWRGLGVFKYQSHQIDTCYHCTAMWSICLFVACWSHTSKTGSVQYQVQCTLQCAIIF